MLFVVESYDGSYNYAADNADMNNIDDDYYEDFYFYHDVNMDEYEIGVDDEDTTSS